MRVIFFLIIIVNVNYSFACIAPRGGDKYDSQIEIEKLTGTNRYKISVPRYIEKMLKEANIMLAYSTGLPGGVPVYDKFKTLKVTVQGKKLVSEFIVEKKDKKPYIVVMWWHEQIGMCGIQANSGYIEVE